MQYQAFFFDFDGVLADSVEVKTTAFAKIFKPYGPEVVAKVVDHHRHNGGMTRVEKFRYYYPEFLGKPLNDSELEHLCKQFSQLVVDAVVAAPEIPGAEEFLKTWYLKVPCFVVSATPEDEIYEIIKRRKLSPFFKEVLGASYTKQANTKKLLAKYNLQPRECLFFGDAMSDYQAAKVCSIDFLAIVPGPQAPLLQAVPEVLWARNFKRMSKIITLILHERAEKK